MFLDLLSNVKYSGLLKISRSGAILRNSFKEAAKILNVEISWPLVLPDFILVFKDYSSERIDDYHIVAVETKWFKLRNINDNLRKAYRNFGQPLRNYIYGFDSIILLHIFDQNIEDNKAMEYSETVKNSIKMLELPVVYTSIQMWEKNVFSIYQPINIDLKDIEYFVSYLSRLTRDVRNPIFKNKLFKDNILKRRAVLKVSLNLP